MENVRKVDKLIEDELNPKETDFKSWDAKKVIRYICSLENGRFLKYKSVLEKTMTEQELTGKDMVDITKDDLLSFGVKNFGDRSALFKSIQKLINNSVNEGNGTSFV